MAQQVLHAETLCCQRMGRLTAAGSHEGSGAEKHGYIL